jgi:folate-binding protein YgfZ
MATQITENDPSEQVAMARSSVVFTVIPRGVVRAEGKDAESHLHAVLSQDLVDIPVGSSRYALLLTPKARVLADPRVIRTDSEGFLLDVEPEAAERLASTLVRYRLRAAVEITRADDAWVVIAVVGPTTDATVRVALGDVPAEDEGAGIYAHDVFALRCAPIGVPRIDLIVPTARATELTDRLVAAGAHQIGPDTLEALRVEAGLPRLGAELDERWMPAESGVVDRAVSFDKGCYIGQEPVTRLHRRGHANRSPRRLVPAAPVRVGDPIMADDKEVGVVTSAVGAPWLATPLAIGIVRVAIQAGTPVTIGDPSVTATVE